jgi:sugar lactone lactonase YvrE
VVAAVAFGTQTFSQAPVQPVNDLPNPYQTVEGFLKLPEGRKWGSTSAVEIDRDGRSIWVGERCGANSCASSPAVDPILLFDASGKLVRSFGAGQIIFPHGIYVDRDGNVWVTDGQDNGAAAGGGGGRARGAGAAAGAADAAGAAAGRGAAAAGAAQAGAGARGAGRGGTGAPNPNATIGHQIIKFSPQGKELLRIGRPGGATGDTSYFWQPNDIVVGPNGNIYVSEGHGTNANDRILIFDRDGKFLRAFGKRGAGPGEFNQPHSLAFDSRGRLFVADRANNRIQIFDQEGKFLEEWKQFSRLSGIYIDRNDNLFGADSESNDARNPGWKRGIRIGSAKDGKVTSFIPDPSGSTGATSAAEGVAVDAAGNVWGAEVGLGGGVKRYVRK